MEFKHTYGKVLVSVDLEGKNWHTFSDGTKIRLERQFDNFNRRETQPINAIVISADDIPSGAEILIHHNSLHDTNKVFDYLPVGEMEITSTVKMFSIPESECFIWKDKDGKWQPLKGYATALRVFKPYKGILEGVEPTRIKDCLYITSGEYNGLVVRTLKAADYQLVFQDSNGQEGNIIRCRHYEGEEHEREEIIAIDKGLTKLVKNGEYYIGLSVKDCKPITESVASN